MCYLCLLIVSEDVFLKFATVLKCPCTHALFNNLVPLIFGAVHSPLHCIVARQSPCPQGVLWQNRRQWSYVCWSMPVSPAPERLRQKNHKFQTSLGHTERLCLMQLKATRDIISMVECLRPWIQSPSLQKEGKEGGITIDKANLGMLGMCTGIWRKKVPVQFSSDPLISLDIRV